MTFRAVVAKFGSKSPLNRGWTYTYVCPIESSSIEDDLLIKMAEVKCREMYDDLSASYKAHVAEWDNKPDWLLYGPSI